MIPIWIAMVFFFLGGYYIMMTLPQKEADFKEARLDVMANDFISYRTAVLNYLEQNPTATGQIADLALSSCTPSCLPLGYTITAGRWSNFVDGPNTVVYSIGTDNNAILPILYERSNEALMIGVKDPATDRIFSVNGYDTGITVPALVPEIEDNAIVMMGK